MQSSGGGVHSRLLKYPGPIAQRRFFMLRICQETQAMAWCVSGLPWQLTKALEGC